MNYGLREVTLEKVATSNSSAASAAFGENVEYVRIVSDTDCWITFAASPTATSSKTFYLLKKLKFGKFLQAKKLLLY